MAAQVHMPQWGMAMKEGKIACWLKKEVVWKMTERKNPTSYLKKPAK